MLLPHYAITPLPRMLLLFFERFLLLPDADAPLFALRCLLPLRRCSRYFRRLMMIRRLRLITLR